MAEATTKDVKDLARIVALLADATAQYLGGSMDKANAAANVRALNSHAAAIHNRLS